MKISELIDKLCLQQLTNFEYDNHDISGCYIGDLLSVVMSRAKKNNVWVTIMCNLNVIAVASITEVACVLLAEGVYPDNSVIDLANEHNVLVLRTDKTSYEIAKEI